MESTRVNKRGEFNVPYGHKAEPIFPSSTHVSLASATLKRVRLEVGDFEKQVSEASRGDFMYLDPPYPPINGTSFFTHYTADRFSRPDQERVAASVRGLDAKGVRVMITNADLPWIRALYRGLNVAKLDVARFVSSQNKKHSVPELVITNYEPAA
jgi:DNA adenine methylase